MDKYDVFFENSRQPFFIGNDINIDEHQIKINDAISLYTDRGLIVAKVIEFSDGGLTIKILDASNDSRFQGDDQIMVKTANIFGVFKNQKEKLK